MWSSLGKYKSIVVSIALFLILDASVLTLNFYISYKIADDAIGVNVAGRQRMLSQRTVKSLYEMQKHPLGSEVYVKAKEELALTFSLFDSTLHAFDRGGVTTGTDKNDVNLKPVSSIGGVTAIQSAKEIWEPYSVAVQALLASNMEIPEQANQRLGDAIAFAESSNLLLLKYVDIS